MSKSRHTEAQIIAALKQVEAGRKAEDVAREQGVSKHTIYAWKAKYGGMDVSEAQEAKPSSCGMRTRVCGSWWRTCHWTRKRCNR
jgi:transposase